MPIAFEARKACPLCQSGHKKSLLDIPYADPDLKGFIGNFYQNRVPEEALATERYSVSECSQCGFIYQDRVLNQQGMIALYSEWVDQQASLIKKQKARSKLFRQYSRQVESLGQLLPEPPSRVRILEYGMGWGFWSRMAKAYGYDVTGYELSKQRCEFAASQGVQAITELPQGEPSFDCIFANQVFEHLPDPLNDLQTLVSCLKPGGLVYIRVPDGRGVSDQLRSHGWCSDLDAIHPFEHINCFTRKSLIDLGTRAGLSQINFPLRVNLSSLWGGIKREISDRYLTTHVLFQA